MHVLSHSLISKMLEYSVVIYSYSALNDLLLSEGKKKTNLSILMYLIYGHH